VNIRPLSPPVELPENVLVSAVMPTRGRREWAARAVQCFRTQTYPNKELVILDDADDPSFAEAPEGAHYERMPKRLIVPLKRNRVCEMATGEIIAHFDSDDWSDPRRLEDQVRVMREAKKAVTGYRGMYFWDESTKQAWLYSGPGNYALGTSLIFTKAWWKLNPFSKDQESGSDTAFVGQAFSKQQLANPGGKGLMVARNHRGNMKPRNYGTHWRKVNKSEIPEGFWL